MNWNWQYFFQNVGDIQKFKLSIEQMEDYTDENVQSTFFKKDDCPKNLIYSPWSYKFFKLKTPKNSITIDRNHLLLFTDDAIKEASFYEKYKNKSLYKYIPHEFMFEIHLAKNSPSGQTKYKTLLIELLRIITDKSISIKGSPLITDRVELNTFLKKEIPNFISLHEELT